MPRKIIVRIKSKPLSISPEYRLQYKLCVILIILMFSCRGNKASIKKINFLETKMGTNKGMNMLRGINKVKNCVCDYDKNLNRVLRIAIINDYIGIEKGKVLLLDKGKELVRIIDANNIFQEEITLLKEKKKDFVTESIFK